VADTEKVAEAVGVLLLLTLPVLVLDAEVDFVEVVEAVEHTDTLADLEVNGEEEGEVDTVEVLLAVVVEVGEAVEVGDTLGVALPLPLVELEGWEEGEVETEGVALGEPAGLPVTDPEVVSVKEAVKRGEGLPDPDSVDPLEWVCVTVTVFVTPVGKADWVTVGVCPRDPVADTLPVTLGEAELDRDSLGDTVGVLELVVLAVMVAVPGMTVPVRLGVVDWVVEADWVLLAPPERDCVGLMELVLLAVEEGVEAEEAEEVLDVAGEAV
jgi:hypothetical protein